MGFKKRNFEITEYIEKELDPKKIIIISCEGSNTEPSYFETIKEKLYDDISVLIKIELVPKEAGPSEPKDIICNLDEFLHTKYDYKSEYNDELWLVWDREKVESRKKHILATLPECKKKNYNIAMSNPLFEFWLLLHVVDITAYDNTLLYENDWISLSKNRRYIDKELSNILENGYSKKNFNKSIVTKNNINRALEQEKLFENNLEKIIDQLGSNIGDLIRSIFGREII
jgi:uncharacterized protein (DUF2344 family)